MHRKRSLSIFQSPACECIDSPRFSLAVDWPRVYLPDSTRAFHNSTSLSRHALSEILNIPPSAIPKIKIRHGSGIHTGLERRLAASSSRSDLDTHLPPAPGNQIGDILCAMLSRRAQSCTRRFRRGAVGPSCPAPCLSPRTQLRAQCRRITLIGTAVNIGLIAGKV